MSHKRSPALTLLGSNISYFTGKMENYLRLKSMQFPVIRKVLERKLGVIQMPAIVLPDGRFCRIADGPDEVHMSQLGKLTARELAA